jgi:leukotriene-A4 hydrolase
MIPEEARGGSLFLLLLLGACTSSHMAPELVPDVHSGARPATARVTHAVLDWQLDFEARILRGSVTWSLARARPEEPGELRLDTRALVIHDVHCGRGGAMTPSAWSFAPEGADLGETLAVPLPAGVDTVRIRYETTALGSGLQWLDPGQTADRARPFLFSQAQAIHARTFLPCQDSPGVRFTFAATVKAPLDLVVLMGARRLGASGGSHRFEMPEPIPSYLLAIAAGRLGFAALGPRTGVWAEPTLLARAAHEFAETEAMVARAEALYGPYRWERYDLLLLPPSFPFGGMENPRLSFITPTILAGDRSLVSLIAHELAHSWSGNLVTNATWSDFWLNEGITVYFERRIVEAHYGRERSEMEAVLGRGELERDLAELPPQDTALVPDLLGRDPDDAFSTVPYEKGYLLLRRLEEAFGRPELDLLLAQWFEDGAFRSRTTGDFVACLRTKLWPRNPDAARSIDLDRWIYAPGLPPDAPVASSPALRAAEALASDIAAGRRLVADFDPGDWSTREWMAFLRALPRAPDTVLMAALDRRFGLSRSGNAEILAQWLQMAVAAPYPAASPAVEAFLLGQGRRKFLRPLYTELAKTEAGLERARAIYRTARARYHPIARTTIDAILGTP